MSLTLVIGGTRSGKSRRAEALAVALAGGRPVRYVATADPADASMAGRIAAHAARRPATWTTVTVTAAARLAAALGPDNGSCVLIDGLGAWLARVMDAGGAFASPPGGWDADAVLSDLDAVIAAAGAGRRVIVVAEEAGQGLVPADPGSRAWLDLLGEAVQRLSAAADHVELVVAGRPIVLAEPRARLDADDPGMPERPVPTREIGRRAGRRRAGGDGDGDGDGDRDGAEAEGEGEGSEAEGEGAEGEGEGSEAEGEGELRRHGDELVRAGDADHAVNVLAGGPPDWLGKALAATLAEAAKSYPNERAAVSALAALHNRSPAEIVPTNGAAQALWLLPAGLRPTLAACVHPGFTEGEAALRAHGIAIVRVLRDPDRSFALDPAAVPEAADLVLVGNPASPSGTLDPASAILALRRPGRTVVVDEAFMDLVVGEPGSLVREALADVVVVRSLTKSLSIPGLRAGYAVAAPGLAERLRGVRPPWSVNAVALAALCAVAEHPEALAAAAVRAAAEREDLERGLAGIAGLRTWAASANFCLVEVRDGPGVARRLRDEGIAVRPAASFPGLGPGHLRITARGPAENRRLVAALRGAVDRASAVL